MDLKELLGENYKEDLTLEQINGLIKEMKLANLSSGKYVDIDKFTKREKELNDLKTKYADYDDLKTKTTDYETIKSEYETLKNESKKRGFLDKLAELKVDKDFAEFVLTKVEPNEKFEENAKEFLKNNPKFLVQENGQIIDSNPAFKKTKIEEEGDLLSALKEKYSNKGE